MKVNTKIVMYWNLYICIYCKKFHPKNPFYEKVKMITKRTIILDSIITISSFDYDCTHTIYLTYYNSSRLTY